MSVYVFTIGTSTRIVRAKARASAMLMAIAAFGPQARDAKVQRYENHLAPDLTGSKVYDQWVNTMPQVDVATNARAMQKSASASWAHKPAEAIKVSIANANAAIAAIFGQIQV